MKHSIIFFVLASLIFGQLQAQKYITRNGFISFYSHTPVEDIEAENNQVTSMLDTESGAMVFAVLMKSFQFEKALMQEHFNEKYVESEKYPKAQFKGKIEDFEEIDFSKAGTYPVTVSGEMSLHGVSQPVSTEGTLEVKDGQIVAAAEFLLAPKDYEIKIPSLVEEKIAEDLEIKVKMDYEPFE